MSPRPFSSFEAHSVTKGTGFARAAVSPCSSAGPPGSRSATERGRRLRIEHLPLAHDPSHAGVFGYAVDDFEIAVELAAGVNREDVHPAVT